MKTSQLASRRSSAPSLASAIRAVVEQAHRCRSVAQAIADPCTLRVIEKANGTAAVVTHTSAVITRAMGYFAAGKALNPLQVTLLAETLLEEYPHETMSDVVVFLRRAAMGGFDDGKTYGALDVPTAMRWWRRYLAEKAEALESTAKADDAAADQVGRSILSLPRVQEAVEEAFNFKNLITAIILELERAHSCADGR